MIDIPTATILQHSQIVLGGSFTTFSYENADSDFALGGHLDSVWLWYSGKRKPERMIEAPTKTQADVLKSFGWEIIKSGVLQERIC